MGQHISLTQALWERGLHLTSFIGGGSIIQIENHVSRKKTHVSVSC
jgi:hypothetical protein